MKLFRFKKEQIQQQKETDEERMERVREKFLAKRAEVKKRLELRKSEVEKNLEPSSLVENYRLVKSEYSSFFIKYKPKDRQKYGDKIIELKRKIDELEIKMVKGVLHYKLNYTKLNNELKVYQLNGFLKDSDEISRFLDNQKIEDSIGYNQELRNGIIEDFKVLCEKAWEDFIITTDERIELNKYCRTNKIDKTQQFLIEREIAQKYTQGFDLEKIIEFYYIKENLSDKEIQEILVKEYNKQIELSRINSITSKLNDDIAKEENNSEGNYKFWKTIDINNTIELNIIEIDGIISSGFEFELGAYKKGENPSLKIMISKETIQTSDDTRLIDIITDGLCYHLCCQNMDLSKFLQEKPLIRERIIHSFSN